MRKKSNKLLLNWKLTLIKSLFILIWLWGSLLIWAVVGGLFIGIIPTVLNNLFPQWEIEVYPVFSSLYYNGFLLVHLLSVIGLSSYIKEEEGKILPRRM
ncbi:MAG: hypothetical protein ACFFB2_02370 [Promethearchaeota archaeon]